MQITGFDMGAKVVKVAGRRWQGLDMPELKLHLAKIGKHTEPFVYLDKVVY